MPPLLSRHRHQAEFHRLQVREFHLRKLGGGHALLVGVADIHLLPQS
jgi:hypothetical protein